MTDSSVGLQSQWVGSVQGKSKKYCNHNKKTNDETIITIRSVTVKGSAMLL